MPSPTERAAERVILVVDDDSVVRTYMVRALGGAGFRGLVARNGGEALSILDSLGATVIWLVVSDLAMPTMTGIELAATIAERWPAIPILLVSGQPTPHWDGPFLHNPFTPDQLVAAVQDLLPPAEHGAGVT